MEMRFNGIRYLWLVVVIVLSLFYSTPQEVLADGTARASWYGAECYGHKTASGVTYNGSLVSFAHRSMRFGTVVEFTYHGRTVRAVCNDRGPFVAGRTFDLSAGLAKKLGFSAVGMVRWRVVNGKTGKHKPKRIQRKRTPVHARVTIPLWVQMATRRDAFWSRYHNRYEVFRLFDLPWGNRQHNYYTSKGNARVAPLDRL